MIIVVRTVHILTVLEHLNTHGSEISYRYTRPEAMGEKELAVIEVTGPDENLSDIKSFLKHWFESSELIILNYIPKEAIEQK